MAERKAVNKYYPPDWDPRKQGSVNKRVGQHPLRDRARKLSQGILVIRFELPYNIWCGGCGNHVGMGVRYNAEKCKVGNYYSTPIYKFRMKCHLCDNYFEIQTDPKNHDYVILSGARRKEQRWDPVANEQIVPEDKATQKKLATDPMYKLEHGSDDHQKGKDKVMSLAQLEESRISMQDDYILNRMARDKFRSEKKQLKEAAEADRAILEKAALDIALVEETEEDRKLAGLMKYSVTSSFEEKQKERRKNIELRPLFSTEDSSLTSSATSPSTSPSSSILPHQRHAQVAISRRGELKQKLGKALQASYRDPFKSERKANGGAIFSSSSQNPSQLGIRLKSPNRTKTVLANSFGKKSGGETSKSDSSLSKPESSMETSMQESEKTELNKDFRSKLRDSRNVLSTQQTLNNSDVNTCEISCKDYDNETPSALKVSQIQGSDELESSPSNECSGCDEDMADMVGSDNDHSAILAVQDLESQASDSHSSNTNPHTSSAESKNTGLQTLMTSYTDSDSESSS